MTHLFKVECADPDLNGAEVFFIDEQYRFEKLGNTVITLQRSDDQWQTIDGEAALQPAAVAVLDQYLMSQH